MPIQQASGAFNTGRDCTVVVQHPLAPGGRIDIPNITTFTCAQVTADVKSDRLDGVQLTARLPKGWTGSFGADRGSSGMDDLFALIDQGWYVGGIYVPATIFQYVQEIGGATSTFQFTAVGIKFSDAGMWKGDSIVAQKVDFEAFRRIKS